MELKQVQIDKFIELHRDLADFESYSEDQKRAIANSIANYYLALFKIHQKRKEKPYKISTNTDT